MQYHNTAIHDGVENVKEAHYKNKFFENTKYITAFKCTLKKVYFKKKI